jgi:hypothetical protein
MRRRLTLKVSLEPWITASDQQRSDWLAAMPAEAQLFAPRPGQKPRTAFLAKLGEIITTAVREAA